MAKTEEAYKCRRSTNRKLYCSKYEGCFHFLFLPRYRLQGGFLFLRFPRGQRIMAKTGKAYKCRRSTNRKLYLTKCEGSFHFLFLPRCCLQGGFLFLRFPRGQRIMAKTEEAYK